ncbi:MAG: electron transport complex subunit RsxC [Clostridia bacterium]|nr:electron transport complex subunit RsxC [Clostridia bacterium]
MAFSLHGVHVPHRKKTAAMPAVRMGVPSSVTLPMVMHIGKPAIPVVKVGDHVDVGTLIAEQDGKISSPIYASVSGKVSKIGDMLLSNGSTAPAVTIESDGEMTVSETVVPPTVENGSHLIEAIRKSGIVGLGGAGFPTYVKFDVGDPSKIEELIINGAECEPYITSDTRTMIDRADDMAFALRALEKHLGIKKILIGIENNKKEAIASMQKLAAADEHVKVCTLPALYPQGGEKVLIYHTTGKTVPAGKLPIDVGCVVCNCTTLAEIGRFLQTGMPLVEKCVTVDGGAVKEPKNVIVPIGTALSDVFDFCGGFTADPEKVLYGGPMMGIAVPDITVPVLKQTNAILALDKKEAAPKKTTACLRCGACANHCPFRLDPCAIAFAYKKRDVEELERLAVDVCMECGSCAFNCPAGRPLIENHRLAKALVREARAARKAKEATK